MNAKEKAIELYKKYLGWISNTYYHVGTYSKSEGEKSKECAKIAVQEIINTIEYMAESDEPDKLPYWKEVLEEIENIPA